MPMTSQSPPSPKSQFAVLRFVDGWRVLHNGRRWGRFDYQVDAVDAALRLAAKAREAGEDPEVLVQSFCGELSQLQVA